jgi:hypothetical protein
MTGRPILQTVAIAASAALLVTALAVPVTAAKPKCAGKTATIVGTKKGEVIRGTRKNDVIVARGGHDIIRGGGGNDTICGNRGNDKLVGGGGHDLLLGQLGRDKLFGGPGRDRLLGGPANDALNGGQGNDACLQGSGAGPWLNCERPVIVPPPPPEPPTLVIAYSDINTNHVYDAGDVMIAKIVDTNGDTVISPGDTIKMGQYPTSPNVIKAAVLRSDFEDWKVKNHPVTSADLDADPDAIWIMSNATGFRWSRIGGLSEHDWVWESSDYGRSEIYDHMSHQDDAVFTNVGSPSQPASSIWQRGDGKGDDGFIDVEIYP